MNWIPIDRPPAEFKTVLTIHVDDLFPVCAFRIHHHMLMRDEWFRQIEGPEDMEAPGKNDQLYRPPTHWMELPEPPAVEKGSQ